jgi:hypothetical protein
LQAGPALFPALPGRNRPDVLDGVLRKCWQHGLPDRNAGNSSACARLAHPGRGHRPCHSAALIPGPPGAQSPRPAPAPPPAGASRLPGRALASVGAGGTGLGGSVPRGRGKRGAFPVPARTDAGRSESEPPTPLQWQGPSPLPQRYADPLPAGGPKPPASARPAPGGRFSPAGSDAGPCWCRRHRSWWQPSARAGETRCVSGSRPKGQSLSPDRKEFRGRRAVGLLSSVPVKPFRQSPRQVCSDRPHRTRRH